MTVVAQPVGSEYGLTTERSHSDICDINYSVGLRVTVVTAPRGSLKSLWLEYYFPYPEGFRFLDERDMCDWWKNKAFHSDHHLYEISKGGWMDQMGGNFLTSKMVPLKEWLIKSRDGCVVVLSKDPPQIRELLSR